MVIHKDIQTLQAHMQAWRRQLHQNPEMAFEEHQTSAFISQELKSFGIDVHQGLAETAVIGTLKVGHSDKKIALRADMDALPIQEQNDLTYKSQHAGKMHACGHDGHSAMLLGAAKYLSEHPSFDGTVYFIFQPAEEVMGGAKRMLDEGLFDLFPTQQVYGLHNFPNMPTGHFAAKSGAMMASCDTFEINIYGRGCHAAMPEQGHDPILATAHVVQALQSIVSRNAHPQQAAVVSITQIHSGNSWNAITGHAVLRGTFRCLHHDVQQHIQQRIQQISESICEGMGVKAEVSFNPCSPAYPVTSNTEKETQLALDVATSLVGATHVNRAPTPSMGSEDFSFMLQQKPGCYIWLGSANPKNSGMLHHPEYDFNDDILCLGAAYWVGLVEKVLG